MSNIAYILNLTRSFNANNFLYYFLPGITSGKILIFDDLTKNPITEKDEKIEIAIKLQRIKDHWDVYNLNPRNNFNELKINIVLDLKQWSFLDYGTYSSMPAIKINYLKDVLKSHFDANVTFQYFILHDTTLELEDKILNIDKNNGRVKGNQGIFAWPNSDDIDALLDKDFNTKNEIAEDSISENLKNEFDKRIEDLVSKIKEGFDNKNNENFNRFLEGKLSELKVELNKTIVKNRDLNDNKKKKCVNEFFETFSSNSCLKKGKTNDMVFWFPLDTGNPTKFISHFETLSAFLVESVDFFGQSDPLKFITCGGNNPLISITKIEFNKEETNNLFSKYHAFSQNKEEYAYNEYVHNESIKQFFFNKELNTDEIFKLDRTNQNHFITIDNLGRKIPLFFSKHKMSDFEECFKLNTIEDLEEVIKIQSSRTADVTDLGGDYKLGETTVDLSLKEIEAKIQELKDEEKDMSIMSDVDFDKYNSAKKKYLLKKAELISTFFTELNSLPKSSTVLGFLIASFVLAFAFFAYLYLFTFWFEALISAAVITATLSSIAIIFLFYFRNRVLVVVEKIRLENLSIFDSFNDYVSSLKKIALEIRKSTLRRKNIYELEQTRDILNNNKKKRFVYFNFYRDIVEQLKKNGKEINANEELEVQEIDYSHPPYTDRRITNTPNKQKKLIIKAENSEKDCSGESSFNPLLNVIELIELS